MSVPSSWQALEANPRTVGKREN